MFFLNFGELLGPKLMVLFLKNNPKSEIVFKICTKSSRNKVLQILISIKTVQFGCRIIKR